MPERDIERLNDSVMNDLSARLHELWSGEYEDVLIGYEPTFYSNPHTWRIDLISRTDSGDEHHADWCERRWSFYDQSPWSALTAAVAFSNDLKELAPDDE